MYSSEKNYNHLDNECSGYMSPEYAMYGAFSVKSDVFSFGVLILEIISGKKNGRDFISEHEENLLAHVRLGKQ